MAGQCNPQCGGIGTTCLHNGNCCSGVCAAAMCVEQAPQCNPETCPSGCCSGSTCVTALSDGACGLNGQACQACPAGQHCVGGLCLPPYECESGATQPCQTGQLGICAQGLSSCVDHNWGPCIPTQPGLEVCNGLDDDCDGMVDIPMPPEECNGIDDDCDGQVDEGVCCGAPGTVCAAGRDCCSGICTTGLCVEPVPQCNAETCPNGCCSGSTCVTMLSDLACGMAGGACSVCPAGQHCNVENGTCTPIPLCAPGAQQTCTTELLGICSEGTSTCVDGAWGDCVPQEPRVEVCNGLDDDCNGMVDERPVPEACNGLDDDCDGQIDEDNVCCLASGAACRGNPECCSGTCSAGRCS